MAVFFLFERSNRRSRCSEPKEGLLLLLGPTFDHMNTVRVVAAVLPLEECSYRLPTNAERVFASGRIRIDRRSMGRRSDRDVCRGCGACPPTTEGLQHTVLLRLLLHEFVESPAPAPPRQTLGYES